MAIRPGEKPRPQKYHHHLQYCMKFKAEDTNIATASCDVGMSELHTRFLTTPAKIRLFCSDKIDDFKNKKLFIDPYDRARHISDYTKTLGDDWYLEYFFLLYDKKISSSFPSDSIFSATSAYNDLVRKEENREYLPQDPFLLPLNEAQKYADKVSSQEEPHRASSECCHFELPSEDEKFIMLWKICHKFATDILDAESSDSRTGNARQASLIEERNRLFWKARQDTNESYKSMGARIPKALGLEPLSESAVRKIINDYHAQYHPNEKLKERKRGRKQGQ